MTFIQTAVLAGTVVWGAVHVAHMQTPEEEKQRTEQHVKERYENDKR